MPSLISELRTNNSQQCKKLYKQRTAVSSRNVIVLGMKEDDGEDTSTITNVSEILEYLGYKLEFDTAG